MERLFREPSVRFVPGPLLDLRGGREELRRFEGGKAHTLYERGERSAHY